MTTPRLQLTGITKRYPGVVANSGVAMTVMPGEIHAVLGENGAGKSTLSNILTLASSRFFVGSSIIPQFRMVTRLVDKKL